MSDSVIGTVTVCCVDVSANSRLVRTPSRSVVSSAVACSHGDLTMIRAVSPGL
jgi:hypothetical protein